VGAHRFDHQLHTDHSDRAEWNRKDPRVTERALHLALAAAAALGATACHRSRAPHVASGCSPFMDGQCLTPYPSSWFEDADPAAATKLRVIYPDGTLPASTDRVPLRQSSLGSFDGYSPATPIIAYFAAGLDESQLPGPDAPEASIAADSPI